MLSRSSFAALERPDRQGEVYVRATARCTACFPERWPATPGDKVLVWQGKDSRIWVSSTSASYLQVRYNIPHALIGNIAGADALIEDTLQAHAPND